MHPRLLPAVLLVVACAGAPEDAPEHEPADSVPFADADADADADGSPDWEDCDDADASVYPSAEETCDGKDQDCDGEIDESPDRVWYADADGDGYGDADTRTIACEAPADGWVSDGTDCNDGNPSLHEEPDLGCDGPVAFDNFDGWTAIHDPAAFYHWVDDADLGGDFDGDGRDDLAVGLAEPDTYSWEYGSGSHPQGYVHVFSGALLAGGGTLSTDDAETVIAGEGDDWGNEVGYTLAWLGDIDGDGGDELAIGALYGREAWVVTSASLREGGDVGIVAAASTVVRADTSQVSAAADMNGDGVSELVISSQPGEAWVYYGDPAGWPAEMTDADADVSVMGDGTAGGNYADEAVAADLDGDGLTDLVIEDYYTVDVGFSRVFGYTAPAGMLAHADADFTLSADGYTGSLGSVTGDLDGDGVYDVAVNRYWYPDSAVYVFSGARLAAGGSFAFADAEYTIAAGEDVLVGSPSVHEWGEEGPWLWVSMAATASWATVETCVLPVGPGVMELAGEDGCAVTYGPAGRRMWSRNAFGDVLGDGRADDFVLSTASENFDDIGVYLFTTGL